MNASEKLPSRLPMSRTWYTNMSYARNLVCTFETMGVDTDRLLREVGLHRAALDDPDGRLADMQKVGLWEGALAQTDDPHFGLHVGARAPFGRWGLVEFIAMNSRTLEEALENAIRYVRLMSDAKEVTLVRAGQEVRYVFSMTDPASSAHRHLLESDMVYMLRLIHHMLSPAFVPRAVWFPHAEPEESETYERTFQAPVYFRQPTLALVFDAAWLDRPILLANPRLRAPLEVEAARMLTRLDTMETLGERVATMLQFDPGRLTLDDVCERLHVSNRTLQRRLHEEGTSFRALQDAARKRHARTYLEDADMPLGEISYRLGYSERSAFYRAVKRWFGVTADTLRARLQVGEAAARA